MITETNQSKNHLHFNYKTCKHNKNWMISNIIINDLHIADKLIKDHRKKRNNYYYT